MTTPSWVGAERPPVPTARPPATLVAAVAVVVALAVAEAVHVIGRDDLRPALRGFLLVVIAAQVPVAAARAAAFVGGGDGPPAVRRSRHWSRRWRPARWSGVVAAVVVLVLLARSLRWFPTYAP